MLLKDVKLGSTFTLKDRKTEQTVLVRSVNSTLVASSKSLSGYWKLSKDDVQSIKKSYYKPGECYNDIDSFVGKYCSWFVANETVDLVSENNSSAMGERTVSERVSINKIPAGSNIKVTLNKFNELRSDFPASPGKEIEAVYLGKSGYNDKHLIVFPNGKEYPITAVKINDAHVRAHAALAPYLGGCYYLVRDVFEATTLPDKKIHTNIKDIPVGSAIKVSLNERGDLRSDFPKVVSKELEATVAGSENGIFFIAFQKGKERPANGHPIGDYVVRTYPCLKNYEGGYYQPVWRDVFKAEIIAPSLQEVTVDKVPFGSAVKVTLNSSGRLESEPYSKGKVIDAVLLASKEAGRVLIVLPPGSENVPNAYTIDSVAVQNNPTLKPYLGGLYRPVRSVCKVSISSTPKKEEEKASRGLLKDQLIGSQVKVFFQKNDLISDPEPTSETRSATAIYLGPGAGGRLRLLFDKENHPANAYFIDDRMIEQRVELKPYKGMYYRDVRSVCTVEPGADTFKRIDSIPVGSFVEIYCTSDGQPSIEKKDRVKQVPTTANSVDGFRCLILDKDCHAGVEITPARIKQYPELAPYLGSQTFTVGGDYPVRLLKEQGKEVPCNEIALGSIVEVWSDPFGGIHYSRDAVPGLTPIRATLRVRSGREVTFAWKTGEKYNSSTGCKARQESDLQEGFVHLYGDHLSSSTTKLKVIAPPSSPIVSNPEKPLSNFPVGSRVQVYLNKAGDKIWEGDGPKGSLIEADIVARNGNETYLGWKRDELQPSSWGYKSADVLSRYPHHYVDEYRRVGLPSKDLSATLVKDNGVELSTLQTGDEIQVYTEAENRDQLPDNVSTYRKQGKLITATVLNSNTLVWKNTISAPPGAWDIGSDVKQLHDKDEKFKKDFTKDQAVGWHVSSKLKVYPLPSQPKMVPASSLKDGQQVQVYLQNTGYLPNETTEYQTKGKLVSATVVHCNHTSNPVLAWKQDEAAPIGAWSLVGECTINDGMLSQQFEKGKGWSVHPNLPVIPVESTDKLEIKAMDKSLDNQLVEVYLDKNSYVPSERDTTYSSKEKKTQATVCRNHGSQYYDNCHLLLWKKGDKDIPANAWKMTPSSLEKITDPAIRADFKEGYARFVHKDLPLEIVKKESVGQDKEVVELYVDKDNDLPTTLEKSYDTSIKNQKISATLIKNHGSSKLPECYLYLWKKGEQTPDNAWNCSLTELKANGLDPKVVEGFEFARFQHKDLPYFPVDNSQVASEKPTLEVVETYVDDLRQLPSHETARYPSKCKIGIRTTVCRQHNASEMYKDCNLLLWKEGDKNVPDNAWKTTSRSYKLHPSLVKEYAYARFQHKDLPLTPVNSKPEESKDISTRQLTEEKQKDMLVGDRDLNSLIGSQVEIPDNYFGKTLQATILGISPEHSSLLGLNDNGWSFSSPGNKGYLEYIKDEKLRKEFSTKNGYFFSKTSLKTFKITKLVDKGTITVKVENLKPAKKSDDIGKTFTCSSKEINLNLRDEKVTATVLETTSRFGVLVGFDSPTGGWTFESRPDYLSEIKDPELRKKYASKTGWFLTKDNFEALKKAGKLTSTHNSFSDMIKADVKSAAYRVAATQLTKGTKAAILSLLQKQGHGSDRVQVIAEMLDTAAGDTLVSLLLGGSLTYIPKIKEDPRVQKLAAEFRVNGMATAGNAVVDMAMENILPVIIQALSSIPAETNNEEKKSLVETLLPPPATTEIKSEDKKEDSATSVIATETMVEETNAVVQPAAAN